MTTEQTAQQLELPPPPPGMQWHRTDGWQDGDLPQGWRPFVFGEVSVKPDHNNVTDQVGGQQQWGTLAEGEIANDTCALLRTRRPLTFTHAGKQWTWHRPGDPMPCDEEDRIEVISLLGKTTSDDGTIPLYPRAARSNIWGQTLGWRYVDEKKTVPLGPEDVPPGSVLQKHDDGTYYTPLCVSTANDGVYLHDTCPFKQSYENLSEEWKINRSIPLTGRWNPDAWEPCHKIISENG